LALAHEHLETGGRAERRRARRAELGVHPRHDPRGRVVRRVRDVHAAGRAEHDRARARGLHHVTHDERGFAPLTGAVPRDEELLVRDVLDALDLRKRRFNSHYSRTPIQWHTSPADGPPFAAASVVSTISVAICCSISRPPRPATKPTMTGRFVCE